MSDSESQEVDTEAERLREKGAGICTMMIMTIQNEPKKEENKDAEEKDEKEERGKTLLALSLQ